MKHAIVLGTRPEIIKMSPVIRECVRRNLDYFIIHTGQHYSYDMDRIFFEDLKLPLPSYNLDVGSGSHGRQTGKMLAGIEDILAREEPDIVYVQGDTNTVLAGSLAASKLHIAIGHVEAGLRSFDRAMPEETNRIVADHISDLLFAPTADSKDLLLREGIPEDRTFVTGNSIVDAVKSNLEIASNSNILKRLHLTPKEYMLATLHRQENVDSRDRLSGIFDGLFKVYAEYKLPIIFPIHPRTKKNLAEFGLKVPNGIQLIDPAGFMDFLMLEANASLALTDSGGVQEECCILGVPCVTLRENTERPETVRVGANVLAGHRPDDIVAGAHTMAGKNGKWENPFGDGHASSKILDIATDRYGN